MCKGFLVHCGPVNIDGIKYWTYITLLSMNIKSSCVVFGEKTRESHTDKSSILQSSGWPNIFFWLSINSKISFLKQKNKKKPSIPPFVRKSNEKQKQNKI